MTYPEPLLRLVLGGDLYNGMEQWTLSLHLAYADPQSGPPESVPPAVIAACSTYFATSQMVSQRARLQWLKLNEIGPDGRYTQLETVRHDYATPVAGTMTTANIAPQTALAISLRTEAQRGRAARGRYYLPMPGYQLAASNGLLSPTDAAFYATAATTFLDALNAAFPTTGARVVVASDIGPGTVRLVTNVAVGRAFDTIRSRRAQMVEGWVEGADLAP